MTEAVGPGLFTWLLAHFVGKCALVRQKGACGRMSATTATE
jgi:hypothetical protein